jgi:hypothetical protein
MGVLDGWAAGEFQTELGMGGKWSPNGGIGQGGHGRWLNRGQMMDGRFDH